MLSAIAIVGGAVVGGAWAAAHVRPVDVPPLPANMAIARAPIVLVPRGIGVSRGVLVAKMKALGFSFSAGKGQVMGKSQSGLGYVQLMGAPQDLASAGIMVGAAGDAEVVRDNLTFIAEFVAGAAPRWAGAPAWVFHAMGSKREQISIARDGFEVEVSRQPSLGITVITVRAQ